MTNVTKNMKNKPLQIISLVFGVITTIACLTLGICQLVNLVTLQVGIPKISNVSKFELVLIGIMLFSTLVAMFLFKTKAVKLSDTGVSSDSYLAKKRKAKIALLVTLVSIFFTT